MKLSSVGTGIVFWPVGNGDSSTIVVDEQHILQIDLHKMTKSEDEEETTYHDVVAELEEGLPKRNKKPYLAVFALTHPDQDHCKGFEEMLKSFTIGELWFSPRIFEEYKKDLCDDAKKFKEEAERRIGKTIEEKGQVGAGDRVKVFGFGESVKKGGEYEGLPDVCLQVPGDVIKTIDGEDLSSKIRVFVHSPFKDHLDGDRNDSSLALQVTLKREGGFFKALFFGDLSYLPLRKIYDETKAASNLEWNVFQAPHHCSKSAIHYAEEGKEEQVQTELLKKISEGQLEVGYIIASGEPIPAKDEDGQNPPHAKAKKEYLAIVKNLFLCTGEHPDAKKTKPIVFKLDAEGNFIGPDTKDKDNRSDLQKAVMAVRGDQAPSAQRVGFGCD